ncbi:hypothetical protein [Phenylobacterium sp.]|uniref:hypothetical protein n=1 Tax=Phenylobacterium sp. TaxID=1871053 RepID=UPI002DF0F90D|nr:hypothetical protein [Phenylobacterium sp.]
MFARLTLAAAVATLAVGAAVAQAPQQRLAGTVKSLAAGHLVITGATGDVDLVLAPTTRIVLLKAASSSEIKPGAYLGTANVTTEEGGRATEVHLADNGPNVHSVMNAGTGLMMTNGHVKSVATTGKGQEMDVDYGTGARHVVVPPNTPVTRMNPADVTALKPGTSVTAAAQTATDGKLVAVFVAIQPPKPAKP